MFYLFSEVFNALPLAHLINRKVLVMHGGIPASRPCKLQELVEIDRFRQPPDDGPFTELLWNDPGPAHKNGLHPSKRGIGYEFGPDLSERFCRDNALEYVIRSHEVKMEGYEVAHNGRIVTIFSAPNYCDQMANKGAYIRLYGDDPKLRPEFKTFDAVPHPNVPAMKYAPNLMSMLGG